MTKGLVVLLDEEEEKKGRKGKEVNEVSLQLSKDTYC